ncbi:hemolysin-III channel protein [Colletotrichum tofieldiae]|uniref:Hemolysin-III channel protein n=1 Tax=Colletotrichum tofieldiae TaxID=708197 RepID=A0A166PFR7_9PEZI|nr:hemolysin-III channel protein [Colletotrichum tofieldiae]GKT63264.1 hemolysin-III channel protein [Colletotrichum tofieldiae]GKT72727.1 hemolysin-III channel protein [Colletotrichum tofieldiae]
MTAPKPSVNDASGVRNRNRRPSTTETLLSSVESTAVNLEKKVEKALLVLWDDLPAWRRDNAFIISGYRPDSNSYLGSFKSLGYLHNESVNIWSHLLGAVAFLVSGAFLYGVVAPRYDTASPADVLVFGCFFAGAVACLGMSATYHAVCNHSPEVAKWGNKLDYSGIVFLIVGSYVPAMYYGFFCHPGLMKFYLWTINLLGLGCGAVSWIEFFRTPEWRTFRACMFVALGTSGVIPVLHGATIYGRDEMEARMSLSWVVLHGAMYIFGAFLYAFRWPERSFPGTFDIWGSSHQIFHFFVVMAAVTHLYGMAKAFDYHHSARGLLCL